MNSNKKNSNNFLLGVSSNKNNSFEKINNETMNNEIVNNSSNIRINNGIVNNQMTNNTKTYSNNIMNNISKATSPLNTKKIIFGIIDKLEHDIIKLNNKINALNKEKVELKDLSNKEIKTLKEVIKKLYSVLSSFYNYKSSSNLSKNDRIKLLNKLKNTIEQNESFMEITNKIVRNNKSFNNISLINESHNNVLSNNESSNNNVSLSNIIANKKAEAINNRMNDNAFVKREESLNNKNIVNNSISNEVMNNSVSNQVMNNSVSNKVINNSVQISTNSVSNIKELSNNKNIYKSENKELIQAKRIPLINKIEEHKLSQENANQRFNQYKKFL
jgi:hypothetical protein